MRNINVKDAKFICNVWGGGEGWYVTEKRGFNTFDGALRFASETSLAPTILEVSIVQGDHAGRLYRLASFKDGKRMGKDE